MRREVESKYWDYFNEEINLFIILLMLECRWFEDKNSFSWLQLKKFLPFNLLEIGWLKDNLIDTGDYGTDSDFVFDSLGFISDELKFFNIHTVRVKNIFNLIDDLLVVILKNTPKENEQEYISAYSSVLESAFKLQQKYEESLKKIDRAKVTPKNFGTYDSLELKDKHLYYFVIEELPENISLSGEFNDKEIKKTKDNLELFLRQFANDEFIDETGKYFSQQIVSFQKYIDKLPKVNNSINIPFQSMTEKDFSVIKILKTLEILGVIEPIFWGMQDISCWKLKFINDDKKLSEIINEMPPMNIENTNSKANIFYDKRTGKGSVNGTEFVFSKTTSYYHLFKQLYENINGSLSRYDVLVTIGFYEEGDKPDPVRKTLETGAINKIVKYIRKQTSLNTKNLVQNAGSLTLIGEKVDDPNMTQD